MDEGALWVESFLRWMAQLASELGTLEIIIIVVVIVLAGSAAERFGKELGRGVRILLFGHEDKKDGT